jgi:hypothetical protein
MIKRPFEQWEFEDVEIEFGILPNKNLPTLISWLDVPDTFIITPFQEELRLPIEQNINTWNEDEITTLFIAPFLLTFKFNNPPQYRVFMQRKTKLETATISASGKVEFSISTGKQKPQKSFFFQKQYKAPQPFKEENAEDPLGQLLIMMLNTQIPNTPPSGVGGLLYGCYTLGRYWFFVVLVGKEYGVSRSYDATQTDDMNAMVYILERVKEHIHQELNLPSLYMTIFNVLKINAL